MDAYVIAPNADAPVYWEGIRQELTHQQTFIAPPQKKEGDWCVQVSGNSVEITEYNGSDTVIQVPSQILGLPVTGIGIKAFKGKNLISVSIPDSVISIGEKAFYKNRLTSLTIGNNVTSIGRSAFEKNQLSSVTIPDNVKSIEKDAFAHNPLTCVIIPDREISIAGSTSLPAFGKAVVTQASVYAWEQANAQYTNKKVFDLKKIGNGVSIYRYKGIDTDVNIPPQINGVPVIGIESGAFWKKGLTSVIIPDTVTSIRSGAFSDNQLTSVTIPNSVTSIEDSAFRLNKLKNIVIPDSVTSLDGEAFDKGVVVYLNN